MKKVLALAVVMCMLVGGVAVAKTTNCVVSGVGTSETTTSILINCSGNDVDLKKGTKVKIRVQKPKSAAVEGC